MNKKRLYISLILATILFNACGGEDATIKEEIDKMTPPQSAYSQEEVITDKSLDTKEAIVEKNDLRELLIGQQYYITLKDKENNINHFSWKFTKDGISSTKLNGYTKTTLIPYQINENILSVSIDDQAKIFTFEAEDSDYLIFEDKKEDIRFYNSVNKSNIFFNKLKEENVITDKPTTKSELTKAIEGNTFFLPATKDGKKALFKLDFQKNGIVIINGIEGYSLMMEIAYKVEDKTLKFNSDQRVFDSDKGDYLLFTDNSRMYKNQTNAKIYLDTL